MVRQLQFFSSCGVRNLSGSVSGEEEDRYIQTSSLPTMHFQPGLLRLPIPRMEDTYARYLAALQPVAPSEEAFKDTKAILDDFMSKNQLNGI